jgi:hypothetical protein
MTGATVLRFPTGSDHPPVPGAFPYRVHAGDDVTGPVVAWFHSFGPGVLEAMAARMDMTVVDTRTSRIVAVGGPILGQLHVDPEALET